MQQAVEYEQAIQGSTTNKIFEVLFHALEGTHPLNAYRALELRRWCQLGEFENMQRFLRGEEIESPVSSPAQISNAAGSQSFCGTCGSPLKEGQKFCTSCGNKCA